MTSHRQMPALSKDALHAFVGTTGWVFAAACVVLGAAYMIHTAAGNLNPKDFSYFWIAGQIWLDGGNPYASDFSGTANAIAAAHPDMAGLGGFHRWLYGPHIWSISTGLGLLDYVTARMLWGALGAAAVIAGCYVSLVSVLRPRETFFPVLFGLMTVLAAVTLGTSMSVSTGQVAPITFLAIAAFAYGVLRGSGIAVALALIVLTMKPNLAMPFLGFALVFPATRAPLVAAGIVSLALSLPVALTTPVPEVISGYLDGLRAYGGYGANAPIALTGLGNLIHAATGLTLSGTVYAALGAMAGALVGRLAWIRGATPEVLAALIAIACFCVPLHLYDMTLVVLFLVLWPWPWWGAVALVANLAMLRANRLGQLAGLNDPESRFPGSFLASVVLLALVLAALWIALSRSRRSRTDEPA